MRQRKKTWPATGPTVRSTCWHGICKLNLSSTFHRCPQGRVQDFTDRCRFPVWLGYLKFWITRSTWSEAVILDDRCCTFEPKFAWVCDVRPWLTCGHVKSVLHVQLSKNDVQSTCAENVKVFYQIRCPIFRILKSHSWWSVFSHFQGWGFRIFGSMDSSW